MFILCFRTDSNIDNPTAGTAGAMHQQKKRRNSQEKKLELMQEKLENLIAKCVPPPASLSSQYPPVPSVQNPHLIGFGQIMLTILDELPNDVIHDAIFEVHSVLNKYRTQATRNEDTN